ncbi:MAG: hypothetical protein MJ252_00950 [archaeon]|nr:hypothetical protein [archaeon]
MKSNISNSNSLNLAKSFSEIISSIFSLKVISNDYGSSDDLESCFKILVLDDNVFSIISPLVKVFTLRENNICLNINLKDPKEKMPNVMGIYIISATSENFQILKQDIQKKIFDNFYLNFINFDQSNPNHMNMLNQFFTDISTFDNLSSIANISILPLDIMLYHERMFSLDIKRPYLFLNSPNISDEQYNEYISKISNGIFSTLFILKTIPIIKFRTGYFVEDIIKKLQSNFNYLFDKYPEKKDEFILKRKDSHTLLVILDRDTDLPMMMHHSCGLGNMMNDIIGLSRSGKDNKKFEVDPINDYIWNEYLNTEFFKLGEIIYSEYKKYSSDMEFLDKINKPKDMDQLKKESEKLAESIEKLRDSKLLGNILLQESNSFNQITEEAKNKDLGKLYEIEDLLLRKRNNIGYDIKKKYSALIKSINTPSNKIQVEDIYRVCLMYYLTNKDSNQNDIQEIKNIIPNQNALKYLKNKKEQSNKGNSAQSEQKNYWHSGLNFVMNSLNSLMSVEQPSISADIVNSLFFNKKVNGFNTYNTFKKAYEKEGAYTFSDVIVFVVGGGSFNEFEYIDELMKKNDIKTIYGCDYIYRPNEFVEDLEKLGELEN